VRIRGTIISKQQKAGSVRTQLIPITGIKIPISAGRTIAADPVLTSITLETMPILFTNCREAIAMIPGKRGP